MNKLVKIILHFLKNNIPNKIDLIVCLILGVGIFLRIWQLETKMIFFADAGRDMLAAVEMTKTGNIPLLGIPSSVPRFKQGPLFVWFSGIIFLLFGQNPLLVGYAVSLLNCVALLGCYLLVKKHVSTTAGLLTLLLLATSPLAIAHSRMPYHITPIIGFFLLYLWSLQRLAQKKHFSAFFAGLSWAFLFQFELALFPMIVLIFYTIKKTQLWSRKIIFQIIAGLVAGLTPQILFDLTNRFAQLGGFLAWMLYRIASFFWIGKAHSFSINKLEGTWSNFLLFFSRIFSVDHQWIGFVFLILLIISLIIIWRESKQNLFLQHTFIGLVLLLLAFIVHGSPSEAYFPPIILLSIISIGCATSFMAKKTKIILSCALSILAIFNIVQIKNNNFFTLPVVTDFQYGASYREQVSIMKFILNSSRNQPYELRSTDPESHFVAYLDNFRMIGVYLQNENPQIDEQALKKVYFINKPGSELVSYPLAKIVFFDHFDVIELPENL